MAYVLPQPAIALPPSITFDSIRLDTKPTASLECSQVQSAGESGYSNILVVFLNGLIAPQSFWLPIMALTLRHLKMGDSVAGSSASQPQMLAYDRYGQGRTIDRDPSDEGKEEGYGHDTLDAVRDLYQLISQTAPSSDDQPKRIVFVANSIGCAMARLFSRKYPGTVAGLLLLDSIMANSDFVSLFPDPDSPDFDRGSLPEDVTPEMLYETRKKFRDVFHPSVKNAEGLDRRNLAALLPDADKPSLEQGFGGGAPFVTVVGHDPEWFAQESLQGSMKTPISISMNYTNPTWHRYNQGLTRLTNPEKASGPIIAMDCGHFIQRDNPTFVAELVYKMLVDVVKDL
ncbi:putative alpha beta hydrolase family protein [Rosellinia necatrix]|uniref:Putative alpha beta hydrolase family protein n=1 Tax=Rosellinia necatrix TaxID=77044 RepID=A0A1W2TKZ9_ROSNE|nr:putative alpha beta hydrolase family protein [Rosellinia necatrix]